MPINHIAIIKINISKAAVDVVVTPDDDVEMDDAEGKICDALYDIGITVSPQDIEVELLDCNVDESNLVDRSYDD